MNRLYDYMKMQGENSHWKKTTNEEIQFRMQEDFNEAIRVNDDISKKDSLSNHIKDMIDYLDNLMLYVDMVKE